MDSITASKGERRRCARRLVEIDTSLKPGLAAALMDLGLVVRSRAHGCADMPAAGLRVAGGSGGRLDEALAEAERATSEGSAPATLSLLVDGMTEAQALRAAALTPLVHPLALPAGVLAALIAGAAATWACRLRRACSAGLGAGRALRTACIRLGEAFELDGVPVALGVAERNFLFELAERRGKVISKEDDIETEGGRSVAARECRRRLGKRLGATLAALLVPEVRGEPYRLREPDEIEALAAEGRASLCLRIIGRASARLHYVPGLDRFAAR